LRPGLVDDGWDDEEDSLEKGGESEKGEGPEEG